MSQTKRQFGVAGEEATGPFLSDLQATALVHGSGSLAALLPEQREQVGLAIAAVLEGSAPKEFYLDAAAEALTKTGQPGFREEKPSGPTQPSASPRAAWRKVFAPK